MLRKSAGFIVLVAIGAAASHAWAQVGAAAEAPMFVERPGLQEFSGQLIARPVQDADWAKRGLGIELAAANAAAAKAAIDKYQLVEYVWQTDEYVIDVGLGAEEPVARELLDTGLFQYVHPNWIVYPLACPNDPQLGNQWHHNANRMNSCAGWDIHTGNPSVVIAYCDTGIRTTHQDLLLHRREAYNAVNRVWESAGGQISDINGHGTNVTGCGSANGNNGVGIAGVGWNLGHRMMRVTNSGGGGSDLNSLNHAARTAIEAGDRVASVSYSGVDNSTNLTTATYIKSIGGLLVWAAGNDNRNITFGHRDADDIIVVGATTSSDAKASFSAYGIFVDLVAPGVDVYTTSRNSDSSYSAVSGTSFACPLTAGLAGLIWSANPALTPNEVEAILKAGCTDLGAPGVDNTFGYGRINVLGSLSLISTLKFNFPNGLPTLVDPVGGTTVRVEVTGTGIAPIPGSGKFHYNLGGGWHTVDMIIVSPNVYDAVFPASTCASEVAYYFSAQADNAQTYTSPGNAPAATHAALSAKGFITIFEDNFDTNKGWTAGAADDNATSGHWNRMAPQQTSTSGIIVQPGFVVSGTNCWVTDGRAGSSVGEFDVDNGKTTLFSPIFDLEGQDPTISYWRWFSNHAGAGPYTDVFVLDVSTNGGSTWTNVQTIGPSGQEVEGGWRFSEFRLKDYVTPTANVRFRFVASDYNPQSLVEACVDDFRITVIDCGPSCKADCNGDTVVDTLDFICFLNAFNSGGSYADFNGDTVIDTLDFIAFLNAFTAGCP
ncbi:MAG: S8 family serine peptidase [Phycisphaeraceae bacterium]|nr:S8 family serine peptidase [Phycisphaeraceae bacterium]